MGAWTYRVGIGWGRADSWKISLRLELKIRTFRSEILSGCTSRPAEWLPLSLSGTMSGEPLGCPSYKIVRTSREEKHLQLPQVLKKGRLVAQGTIGPGGNWGGQWWTGHIYGTCRQSLVSLKKVWGGNLVKACFPAVKHNESQAVMVWV